LSGDTRRFWLPYKSSIYKDGCITVVGDHELTLVSPGAQDAADTFVRALYDDVPRSLFVFVLRLTGSRYVAEDVVQEALARAWRRVDHLDLESDALRRWLFTVARNLVTDLWRSDSARPVIVSDECVMAAASAVDEVDQAVQRWALADALNRLTPKHRDILIEIYYEGRSVAEVAQRLGVPPGTARSRIYRALRALRLLLQEVEAA
jgi:RNA polymerase sigma-70 factor (ECF subfamily)